MANRERGDVDLALSGVVYRLRLTVAAVCDLEDRTGRTLETITKGLSRGQVRDVRAVLWAALQPSHASAFSSFDSVGALIDAADGPASVLKALSPFLLLNMAPKRLQPRRKAKAPKPETETWRRLYVDLRASGLPAGAFWDLSLRELWMEIDVVRAKTRRSAELAYMIEFMARQERISGKSIDQLVPSIDAPVRQSYEEMRAVLESLSGSLGRPLIRIPYKAAA